MHRHNAFKPASSANFEILIFHEKSLKKIKDKLINYLVVKYDFSIKL